MPGKEVRVSRDVVCVEQEFRAPIINLIMRDKSTGRFAESPAPNQWQQEHAGLWEGDFHPSSGDSCLPSGIPIKEH